VLWIGDTANHRLRCVNAPGTIRTVAGTGTGAGDGFDSHIPAKRGPALQVEVPYPRPVGVDSDGNVYVTGDAYATIPKVVQMVAKPAC
jgi:beta-propeller repeat-containing protein